MFTFSLKDMKQSTCFFQFLRSLEVLRIHVIDKNCTTESKAFLDKNFISSIFKIAIPGMGVLKLVVKRLLDLWDAEWFHFLVQ